MAEASAATAGTSPASLRVEKIDLIVLMTPARIFAAGAARRPGSAEMDSAWVKAVPSGAAASGVLAVSAGAAAARGACRTGMAEAAGAAVRTEETGLWPTFTAGAARAERPVPERVPVRAEVRVSSVPEKEVLSRPAPAGALTGALTLTETTCPIAA